MIFPDDFLNKIINANCLDILPLIPDNSIDCIVTDPPYMISRKANFTGLKWVGSQKREQNIIYDFGKWDWFKSMDDYQDFTKKWFKECYRILRNGSIVSFFSKERMWFLWKWWEELGGRSRNILTWRKTNPVPQIRKVGFQSATEFMFWGTKGKHTFNWEKGQCHNFIETPLCMGNERLLHPTQKPIAVIMWLLRYLTNKDDVVLDPFLGTGTTALAAKRLVRNYIGIEIDPKYVKMAEKRLAQLHLGI